MPISVNLCYNIIFSIYFWQNKMVVVVAVKAQSFLRATLSEKCSLFGTHTVREQISEEAIVYKSIQWPVIL